MKILIVDDHALFREGLVLVLNKLDGEILLLEAADFDQALQLINLHCDIDMIMLDLDLPDSDGFESLNTLIEHHPNIPVVIVSASDEALIIQNALNAGAMGFIPKASTSSVMLNALQLILNGGIYVPQEMLHRQQSVETAPGVEPHNLTSRQLQVLDLLVHGQSNKDIAETMFLAESTVKMHVSAILRELGVSSRTQAVLMAKELGYTTV